jgi:MFS transporter, PAT family, beta-lactamase induction signal transducer AmpG
MTQNGIGPGQTRIAESAGSAQEGMMPDRVAEQHVSRLPGRRRLPDARLWLMAAYGFVAGLPLPLSGFTFRLWMSESNVSLAAIGLTANIGLAYTLKFLWAPFLDHAKPPGPLARLGRRRGWLLALQPALVLACVLLAVSDPAHAAASAVAAAALVAFLSASQDIVVDAWRIETFPARLQGAAMAAYVWGYRSALLVSGAGAIKSADLLGWHGALLGVAALVGLGPLITLLAPEPVAGTARLTANGILDRLAGAVVEPLREFLTRPGAATILAFVALFKLGEAMAGVMTAPFYRALGFDRAAIAVATGPFSLAATFAGTAVGGWLVAKLGVGRALLWTGSVQTLAMAMYLVLAYSAGERHVLYATVVIEAFAEGMADAAFITYLSGLCSVAFTATQYALLSSLAAIALRTVGGLSGFLAEALGWKLFYTLSMFAAVPAMIMMLRILRRFPPAERAAPGAATR